MSKIVILEDGTIKRQKKLIGRLPREGSYKIERVYHTFSESNDSGKLADKCENCNKAILNVAIVKHNDKHEYKVGLDCASTLNNMDLTEVEKYAEMFKFAKAERTRILSDQFNN